MSEVRRDVVLVAAATVLGALVRVWLASRSEVWLDEANSILIALTPLSDFAATLRPDSSPPLYYLLLKIWTLFAPLDPFWLRVPSLLLGCATIPMLWWIGTSMDRPRTGLIAAWLLALNPLHAYYSEEIRMYAMLVLLGLVFYFALFHVLRHSGRVGPAFLAGTALTYTHYYGLVFTGAALLVALGTQRERRRGVFTCGLGIGLAFLPWLPIFLAQLENPHHVNWITDFWRSYPGAFGIVRTLQAFLPGGMTYAFVPMQGVRTQAVIAALGMLPFLALATRADRKQHLSAVAIPGLVLAATLLILVLRSYTGTPIYLPGRSDVVVLPLFLLMLATALSRLGPRQQGLFLAAWAVLFGIGMQGSAEMLRKTGNLAITSAVSRAECRAVVATGLTYAPVLVYQIFEDSGAQVVPFPIDVGSHPGNLDPSQYSFDQLASDAHILAREFPPEEGLCVLAATSTFSGPLSEAYTSVGGTPQELGVFYPSMIPGSPFVLVSFSESEP